MILKESFISNDDLEVIDSTVMTEGFPWYYCDRSTSKDFPFLKHSLISRESPIIDSSVYPLFKKMLFKFCDDKNIEIQEILRGCLNLTYYTPVHEFVDPHVDHPFETWSVLMYLNEFSNGETLIFNEQYGKDGWDETVYSAFDIKKFQDFGSFRIKKMITPKKGKIVGFYGSYFHSAKWCLPSERRIVCVFTFK